MDWKNFLRPTLKKAGYFVLFYFMIYFIFSLGFLIIRSGNAFPEQIAPFLFMLAMLPVLSIFSPVRLILTIFYVLLVYLLACVVEGSYDKKSKIILSVIIITAALVLYFFMFGFILI